MFLQLFCLVNQRRTKGEGWSTANWFKPLSNFIAGRPKAALLFWFFGGFRSGPEVIKLFTLNSNEHKILIAQKYENIKKFSIFQTQISLECYFFCA